MIHHDHTLKLAVIRLEDNTTFCTKSLHSAKFIEMIFLPGTELNGSTIKSITVYPYSKEIEEMYKN